MKPVRRIEKRDDGDRGEDGPGRLEGEGGGKDREGNCAEERQQIVSQMPNVGNSKFYLPPCLERVR